MTVPCDHPGWPHDWLLGVLARAARDGLKAFAETLIVELGDIEVRENPTGLVGVPMRDTAQDTHLHHWGAPCPISFITRLTGTARVDSRVVLPSRAQVSGRSRPK